MVEALSMQEVSNGIEGQAGSPAFDDTKWEKTLRRIDGIHNPSAGSFDYRDDFLSVLDQKSPITRSGILHRIIRSPRKPARTERGFNITDVSGRLEGE